MLQHVAGDEHVGDALGVGDYDGRWLFEKGQGGQKAGNQLRAILPGNLGDAGDDAAFDLHGDGIFADNHAERGHDVAHSLQGAAGKGFLAGDGHGTIVDGGHQRDHQARQQAGFAGMQGLQVSMGSAYAVDGKGAAVQADLGSEGTGYRKGGLAVFAGRISAEMAAAGGEGGGDDGTLREAFGCRHLQGVAEESFPGAVHLAVHGHEVDLPGGGGFVFVEGGVAEGGAGLEAGDAGGAASGAHGEGHKA